MKYKRLSSGDNHGSASLHRPENGATSGFVQWPPSRCDSTIVQWSNCGVLFRYHLPATIVKSESHSPRPAGNVALRQTSSRGTIVAVEFTPVEATEPRVRQIPHHGAKNRHRASNRSPELGSLDTNGESCGS